MGSAVTVNALRGILVHDERINASSFSETLSSYSEAGAHPGVPVPSRASSMVLESSGEMDSGTVTIRTVRAGGVSSSPDGEIEPGAFAMRTNGIDWLGWNGPLVDPEGRVIEPPCYQGQHNVRPMTPQELDRYAP
jgi:hypothetical protein